MYSSNKNKGFTLIELIIAITIISVMSGLAIVSIVAQNKMTASKYADQVVAQINTLYSDSLYVTGAYGCICGNENGVWFENYGKNLGAYFFDEHTGDTDRVDIKVTVPKNATAGTEISLREAQTYQSIFGETFSDMESKVGSLWYAKQKFTYNSGRFVIVNQLKTFALELRSDCTAIYLDYMNHEYIGPSELTITYRGESASVYINAFGKAYR